MTMEKVRERIMEAKKELDRTKYEGGNLDKIKTAEDYLIWAEKAIEEKTIAEEAVPPKKVTPPTPLFSPPKTFQTGVGGVPIIGIPKAQGEGRAIKEAMQSIPLGPTLEQLEKQGGGRFPLQPPPPSKTFTVVKRKF